MFINYDKLKECLVGKTIKCPSDGTLSGHVIGEPFDKLVSKCVKEQFPNTNSLKFLLLL